MRIAMIVNILVKTGCQRKMSKKMDRNINRRGRLIKTLRNLKDTSRTKGKMAFRATKR